MIPNIQENKLIIVENFESPAVTKEILYKYFKQNLKTINLNPKKNTATLEFDSEKSAKEAMNQFNCKPILKRPIIMGFKNQGGAISLQEFHLVGLENVDLNRIYRTAAKYGKSCKFSFHIGDKNKVVNRGYLSYLSISTQEIEAMKKDLAELNIKCEVYDRKKQKKITIKIEKFEEDFKKDPTEMVNKVKSSEEKLKKLLAAECKFDQKDYKISVSAFDKDGQNTLVAYLSFDQPKKAVQVFERVKSLNVGAYFDRVPAVNIRLSDDDENYTNLITVGLTKKNPAQKDSDFQDQLLKAFKENFQGVLQVSLRVVRKKGEAPEKVQEEVPNKYMAFINLESEEFGKELIATYLNPKKKEQLKKFYVAEPFVNLYCSANFLKDYKKARANYKRIERDIKNNADNIKKEQIENKQGRQMPPRFPSYPPTNPMNPLGGAGMPPRSFPPVSYPPQGFPPGQFPPQGSFPTGFPMPNMMMQPLTGVPPQRIGTEVSANDLKARKIEFLKEKESLLLKEPTIVKRIAFQYIKLGLDELNYSPAQSANLTNQILRKEQPRTLFTLIENLEELKKKAEQYKQVQ